MLNLSHFMKVCNIVIKILLVIFGGYKLSIFNKRKYENSYLEANYNIEFNKKIKSCEEENAETYEFIDCDRTFQKIPNIHKVINNASGYPNIEYNPMDEILYYPSYDSDSITSLQNESYNETIASSNQLTYNENVFAGKTSSYNNSIPSTNDFDIWGVTSSATQNTFQSDTKPFCFSKFCTSPLEKEYLQPQDVLNSKQSSCELTLNIGNMGKEATETNKKHLPDSNQSLNCSLRRQETLNHDIYDFDTLISSTLAHDTAATNSSINNTTSENIWILSTDKPPENSLQIYTNMKISLAHNEESSTSLDDIGFNSHIFDYLKDKTLSVMFLRKKHSDNDHKVQLLTLCFQRFFLIPIQEVILFPYRVFNNLDYEGQSKFENIKEYLMFIEKNSSVNFYYILNLINSKIFSLKKIYDTSVPELLFSYQKFYQNLSTTFDVRNYGFPDKSDYESFFNTFIEYKKWFNDKYKILELESRKTYCGRYRNLLADFSGKLNIEVKNILEFFIYMFKSENYKFLIEILPCFNFLHKIETNSDFLSRTVYVLNYLQLIICKIEIFRYNFFVVKENKEIFIEYLYQDIEFNNTILEIGILFRRILFYCDVDKNTKEVLDIYNFLYFIKAYYCRVFNQSADLKLLAYADPFQNNILEKICEVNGNIKSLRLTYKTKGTSLYGMIEQKLKENEAQILPLEEDILLLCRQ